MQLLSAAAHAELGEQGPPLELLIAVVDVVDVLVAVVELAVVPLVDVDPPAPVEDRFVQADVPDAVANDTVMTMSTLERIEVPSGREMRPMRRLITKLGSWESCQLLASRA
jgi:hypothetical protein